MRLLRLTGQDMIHYQHSNNNNMNQEEFQLYRDEIVELTHLLKEEWIDLKVLLQSCNLDVEHGLLINYYEDEFDNQYGYFINPDAQLFYFEIDKDEQIKATHKEIDGSIEINCPQYVVALEELNNLANKRRTD